MLSKKVESADPSNLLVLEYDAYVWQSGTCRELYPVVL
jgi:hypothetical protein